MIFVKRICKNCKITPIYSMFHQYCRVCQENYEAFKELMDDKMGKTHTFKKYVEDNILSKINGKQLLTEYSWWLSDEKIKEEEKMIQEHHIITNVLRDERIDDPPTLDTQLSSLDELFFEPPKEENETRKKRKMSMNELYFHYLYRDNNNNNNKDNGVSTI